MPITCTWFISITEARLSITLRASSPRTELNIVGFEYFGRSNKACFMFDYSNVLNSSSKAWLHAADLTWIGTPLADPQPVRILESYPLMACTCIPHTRAQIRFAAS